MRIAINATEAFSRTRTGTGVYVRHLVRSLQRLQAFDEIVLLGISGSNLDTSFVSGPGSVRLLRGTHNHSLWSQVRLPLHLMKNRYDLVHIPEHKLPRRSASPLVVTIHDLACFKFPGTFKALHRRRLSWFTRDAILRADQIIAVSESTKNDICSMFRMDPQRVDVVHHGVDHDTYHPGVDGPPTSHPYILSVGALQPRKNYSMLIRAFNNLCRRVPEKIELMIVGQPGWLWEPIRREAERLPFADRVHFMGYVPDKDLPGLFSHALFVAMPSLYEGFGIPLVEAMASGAPVIAANVSCFPEVLGGAGILLDPMDEEAWTETMLSLLFDDSMRKELSQKGLERSRCFSWDRTARETFDVYRKVAGERGS